MTIFCCSEWQRSRYDVQSNFTAGNGKGLRCGICHKLEGYEEGWRSVDPQSLAKYIKKLIWLREEKGTFCRKEAESIHEDTAPKKKSGGEEAFVADGSKNNGDKAGRRGKSREARQAERKATRRPLTPNPQQHPLPRSRQRLRRHQ